LTPGQAHALDGADELLPTLEANIVLADKAYDADERGIAPLRAAGKEPVIPSKRNRNAPRPYDKELYKARHLIEIFFVNSSSSAPSPPATTKPRATFWRQSISLLVPSCLIDDTPRLRTHWLR
jgi:transposase